MAFPDSAVTKVPADSGARFKEWPGSARTVVSNALDAVSPACAPFAAWWDAEAERRHQLRTPENLKALMKAQRANSAARSTASAAKAQRATVREASGNPWSRSRRAARAADRAARRNALAAGHDLKDAHKNYPMTLGQLAVRAHAAHAVPAGLVSYVWSTSADWLVWPAGVSASLIAANAAALRLGRRVPAAGPVDESLSAEEQRLVGRLDPGWWEEHAEARGLAGTLPTPVEVTSSGLVTHIRLDDRWTPPKFRDKADEVRALLGARTDLRMEIKSGSHGDRATLTLRTRSAADGISLDGWYPGAPWGIDTVTGGPVMVPLGRRMLVTGTSGSGKSWSTRPLLAEASEYTDHRLVVVDMKQVEARNWEHRARTASTPDDILEVSDELLAEMHERLSLIPRGEDVIKISPDRPRITVFVDEGAEAIAAAKTKTDKDGPDYGRIIENLRTLARMARAAEIILIWATQKSTMSGDGHGIDSQIAAQITYRASLAVSTAGEAMVTFGQDAIEKGWLAHELPMPGYALLRHGPKAKPHHIKTRAFSPKDVIGLPERPVWGRAIPAEATPAAPGSEDSTVVMTKNLADGLTDNQLAVWKTVRDGAATNVEVSKATGLNPGSVDRAVKALVKRGLVVKDGPVIAAAGVSR